MTGCLEGGKTVRLVAAELDDITGPRFSRVTCAAVDGTCEVLDPMVGAVTAEVLSPLDGLVIICFKLLMTCFWRRIKSSCCSSSVSS